MWQTVAVREVEESDELAEFEESERVREQMLRAGGGRDMHNKDDDNDEVKE